MNKPWGDLESGVGLKKYWKEPRTCLLTPYADEHDDSWAMMKWGKDIIPDLVDLRRKYIANIPDNFGELPDPGMWYTGWSPKQLKAYHESLISRCRNETLKEVNDKLYEGAKFCYKNYPLYYYTVPAIVKFFITTYGAIDWTGPR